MKNASRNPIQELQRIKQELERKVADGAILDRKVKFSFLHRFFRALKSLRGRIASKWWLEPALCIALYLQVSIGDVSAQHFIDPVGDPFGLMGFKEDNISKFVDLDGDSDYDMVSFQGVDEDSVTARFFENIGSSTAPVYDEGSIGLFGINLQNLPGYNFFFELGDLDNDGDYDLLAAVGYDEYKYNQIFAYFENTGSSQIPQFSNPELFQVDADVLILGGIPVLVDIDGDGDLDILTTSYLYYYSYDPYIYYSGWGNIFYENIGTPEEAEFLAGKRNVFNLYVDKQFEHILLPAFGDLDGDGDLDVISFDYTDTKAGEIGVFIYQENIGSPSVPSFGNKVNMPFGLDEVFNDAIIPQLLDLDNDGDLDLMGSQIYIYEEVQFHYFENIGTSSFKVEELDVSINLFPNPAQNSIRIKFASEVPPNYSISLLSVNGSLVKVVPGAGADIQIPVRDLDVGTYVLQIDSEGKSTSRKVVIQRTE